MYCLAAGPAGKRVRRQDCLPHIEDMYFVCKAEQLLKRNVLMQVNTSIMRITLLAIPAMMIGLSADDGTGIETRYSVSLTGEGRMAVNLTTPVPSKGDLLLLQPSFALRFEDRWRFSTSIAAYTSTQGDTHATLRVKETYAGYSGGDFDFSVGKRMVRWGTGYAFTATGILDPPRIATDPSDRLNLNEGREMIKGDWISGQHNITVAWASAGLLAGHLPGMHETTAIRYNTLVNGFDTTVIAAHDRGGATFAGGNFTRVFGDRVEIHGEFAYREGIAALLGGKYTTASGITAVAEFYTPPNTAYYRSGAMHAPAGRQHYGFVRASKDRLRELPGWKQWNAAVSLVANLDDRSRVAVFDIGRQFGNHFQAYVHAQAPAGKMHTEYGTIPYSALLSVGVSFRM